jgi:N6-adenosine-specific RNA methylase IME4
MANVLAIVPAERVPRPTLPEDWDFEKADKDFDKTIKDWRRLTVEGVLFKAFWFYLALAVPGTRTDLSHKRERLPTWTEWVKSKGIGKNTLTGHFVKLRWLKKEEVETPELPDGKYRVIYADPPWFYGNDQHSKKEQDTVLSSHYPSMKDNDLLELDVDSLAAPNSVLFCWATAPRLPFALELIAAWGFEYKAQFIWDKVKHNVGYYNSVRHEILLICTRGSCLPDAKELHDSVVSIERGEHSEKPVQFRELIDKMYTHGKKIILFARPHQICKGWDVWGNEV